MKEKISDPELISEVQRFLYNSYDIIIDKINNPPGKTTQEPFLGSLLLNNSYRVTILYNSINCNFDLVIWIYNQFGHKICACHGGREHHA